MDAPRSSWQVALAAGEPHSTIRVRNLQATVKVGRDAWGRPGKIQPILISATISLREPFEKAVADDSVDNASTVHYGILSKAILEAVEAFPAAQTAGTLRCLLDHVLQHLTGVGLDSTQSASKRENEHPVIARLALKSLELSLLLPKASLIGNGVSLSATTVYSPSGDAEMYSMGLKLHELRIPTLIGVNPNERLAKQIVITNIELDSWSPKADLYNELEEVVVKTIEESSFQTLEALAAYLAKQTIRYFLIPTAHGGSNPSERIKIRFDKPTAVTLADAPVVEILLDTDQKVNGFTRQLLEKSKETQKKPPFPLQRRLDEWIKENDIAAGDDKSS